MPRATRESPAAKWVARGLQCLSAEVSEPQLGLKTAARVMSPRNRRLIVLAAIVAVLLGLRAATPYVIKRYANRELANMGDYRGHVERVNVFLWRGGYALRDLEIVKIASKKEVPFAKIPQMDLTLQWNALLHGRAVGEVLMHDPVLNFVRSESDESSQLGTGTNWPAQIRNLFPFRLNLVEATNGLMTFQAPGIQENDVLTMRDTHLLLRNLTNVQRKNEDAFAEIDLDGRIMGNAPVKLSGKIDPNAETPTFDIDLSLEGAKLVDVNPWLRRFIKVDAAAGSFSMYSELAAAKGHFEGYVKPFLEHPKITSVKEETSGPFQKLWAALVGLAAKIFENRRRETGRDEDPRARRHRGPEGRHSPRDRELGAKRVRRRILPFARRLDHAERPRLHR